MDDDLDLLRPPAVGLEHAEDVGVGEHDARFDTEEAAPLGDALVRQHDPKSRRRPLHLLEDIGVELRSAEATGGGVAGVEEGTGADPALALARASSMAFRRASIFSLAVCPHAGTPALSRATHAITRHKTRTKRRIVDDPTLMVDSRCE